MEMDISFGKHRADTSWKPEYLTWSDFVKRLGRVRRTEETLAEYDKLTSVKKHEVKDGPGFVGGMIRGGRRKKENLENRWLITLDADTPGGSFEDLVSILYGGTAYVIYSTHSHREGKPKYRLVMPASRAMTPDEYGAVARRVADSIGMSFFDSTTFDVHRLMYMPSVSADGVPVLIESEGDPVDVDEILASYPDWTDVSAWPVHPNAPTPLTIGSKPQDPREKSGTIGLLCRAYSIEEGIETFLPDVYELGSMPNRYTYLAGHSGNGLEVFPEQGLAYSHQDSDPAANGRSHNLFDLIRIHKFGKMDDGASPFTPAHKLPSVKMMESWAAQLDAVKTELMSDYDDADFGEALITESAGPTNTSESDSSVTPTPASGSGSTETKEDKWLTKLEISGKGKILGTPRNLMLLLDNGPLSGKLAFDAFRNTEVIRGDLPWRKMERAGVDYEPWLASDDKRLENWLGVRYEVAAPQRIVQNAFSEIVHRQAFHPIKHFIEGATWDGSERAERLLIEYLGAADTDYVKAVTRKTLLAAVTRLYRPGCKFDEMLVLVGPQGAHKSSILAKLGQEWFSDSLRTFDNKEAGEHLQSGWIFEISELAAMKKSEIEEVKAFLSKTEDRYRMAYDRTVTDFPRKGVFIGTTNTRDFLRDATGNRRFWPVEVSPDRARLNHWDDMDRATVQQIWAEVKVWMEAGEKLTLPTELIPEVSVVQRSHVEEDPRTGIIGEWLDKPIENIPAGEFAPGQTLVCPVQIWCEALGMRQQDLSAWDARVLSGVMRNMPGWREWPTNNGRKKFPKWGHQTAFVRIGSAEESKLNG